MVLFAWQQKRYTLFEDNEQWKNGDGLYDSEASWCGERHGKCKNRFTSTPNAMLCMDREIVAIHCIITLFGGSIVKKAISVSIV